MELKDFKYYKYPNPRARRDNFIYLNGEWDFEFLEHFELPKEYKNKIIVPYTYETIASGINLDKQINFVAYKTNFEIKEIKNYLLHFDKVDYRCKVYINSKLAFEHVGGYTSFYFDIKDFIKIGSNTLEVLIYDSYEKYQLRGKQRTRPENYECWYVQYTGIHDNVYLEEVEENYVLYANFDANDLGEVNYEIKLKEKADIKVLFSLNEEIIKSITLQNNDLFKGKINFKTFKLYSANSPILYDVNILINDKKDEFGTYFGFRSIKTKDSKIYINNEELYLKMILNQGYYFNKGVTGTNEEILDDLLKIKYIGFNGIRIHQKIETNLFYYLADSLGIYLWSEIPSAYEYSVAMKEEYFREIKDIILKNYNSPSVITYVLFNESWGIPEIKDNLECQEFVNTIGNVTRNLDKTRLVILNDGWHQLEKTDILSLHEYEQDAFKFYEEYKNKDYVVRNKIINGYGRAFADNNKYQNQPVIISEFGGAAIKNSDGWGYGDKVSDLKAYKEQLINIFNTIKKLDYLSGYCYTQLTDVSQETNGLFYENRQHKLSLDELKEIIEG